MQSIRQKQCWVRLLVISAQKKAASDSKLHWCCILHSHTLAVFFKKRPVLLNALDEAVKMINFTTSQPFEFVMVKDREARRAAVRGVANSRTRLRD